jgi:threonylcarbamoyladenosine tRNA methylthiotransferase MtaB
VSRPAQEILQDIELAVQGGTREIVLTGVHLGSWGVDSSNGLGLAYLIRKILEESRMERVRLSSLEPWDLDDGFFSIWQDPRMCRHLHLPLQSGSARTLRRMARNTTPEKFAALVEAARRAIPGVAITTDLIVGFPGETDTDFEESLEYVKRMNFAGGHVFHYSERPGTASARFPDPVQHVVRKERSARMRALLTQSGKEYRKKFVGIVLPVLWESAGGVGPQGWDISGLTGNYLRVTSQNIQPTWNTITPVLLTSLNEDGLVGNIVSAGD